MELDNIIPKNVSKLKSRDAVRLGIQSALSAIATYLILRYFNLPEVFVGILSAVLVIDTSVGNTIGQAKERLISTVIGSVIGFLCVWLLPHGYSTTVSLLISMLVLNGISSFRPEWRYGTVAAVALSLGSENDALSTSLDRIIAIAIGVAIGIVITLIIWPDKAENRALRFARKALDAACNRFEKAIDNTLKKENESNEKVSNEFHSNLNAAKSSVKSAKFTDTQDLEKIVLDIEKLYNSILIINRVAERSSQDINDDNSGIKEDSEDIKDQACKLMRSLAKKEKINKDRIQQFEESVKRAQKEVNISDDKDINTRRQTFIFGITEVRKSLFSLIECFQETNK